MYALTPAEALVRARAEFPHYEICRFHDAAGVPETVAVLKPPHQNTMLPLLVCAATVAELAATLRAHHRHLPLPRRRPPAER
ncbi:MAG: hypothetical protein M0026_11060 [Nocardiopsaceae bacterium]|nr:hypothetical protein [Nocardiopsaceae bacterium]